MAQKRSLLLLSRKVHLYLGLFVSPALLFFAFTGVYQTLGLHEAASNYHPPKLLAELGQIHKKQTGVLPQRRTEGPSSPPNPLTPAQALASPPATVATTPAAGSDASRMGRRRRDTGKPGDHQAAETSMTATEHGGFSVGEQRQQTGTGRPQLTLEAKQKQHLPLKLFFVLVGVGLFLNTATGVYMAYRYDRNAILVTGLLIAGLAIPAVLLRF